MKSITTISEIVVREPTLGVCENVNFGPIFLGGILKVAFFHRD